MKEKKGRSTRKTEVRGPSLSERKDYNSIGEGRRQKTGI